MNIHLRAISRLIRIVSVPVVIGILTAIIFNTFPVQYILMACVSGLVVFLFYMLYKWTLDDIREQDRLTSLSNKD